MDLTKVIETSIADAADAGEISSDATPDISTEVEAEGAEEAPVVEEVAAGDGDADADVDADADAPAAEKAAKEKEAPVKKEEPKDELTKELEALGLKEPKPGERENRLPYSRVTKIVGNAIKNTTAKFTTQVADLTSKNEANEKQVATYKNVDTLIASDPDRYMGMLAAIHPDKYGKFLQHSKETVKPEDAANKGVVADPADPEPQPDGKYEDGSVGYTPEGFKKLREWDRRQATREADARNAAALDKRLGPIEKERQARDAEAERVPRIRAQVAHANEVWGKDFADDYAKGEKSEILAVMRANDGQEGRPYLPFDACVSKVLTPKLRGSRDTMRADILAELEKRPAKVQKTPAATVRATASKDTPRSMEDVIKQTLVEAGLSS